MITNNPTKILSFPKKKSLGSLYYAHVDQPEEWQLLTQVRGLVTMPENQPIRWELLDEARGDITSPAGMKLKLKIASDADNLAALEGLAPNDLHALDFGHTAVVDHSLIYIQHLSGLAFLELTSTSVGNHGLSFVRNLHSLHSIGLSYSRVTSEGLSYLRDLHQLREIWLSGTKIDDLGLEYLCALPQLVQLGLSSTLVTDAGLFNLVKLQKLLRVYLFNTKVTHNGTQLLKNLLPDCKVKWHPPKIHARDTEHALSINEELDHNGKPDKEADAHTVKAEENLLVESSQFQEKDFWQLIDLLDWQQEGDDAAVTAPLVETLAKLEIADILKFSELLALKLYTLDGVDYAKQIGSDAYIGNKGDFAKNWFLYVRCCVIANGREFYYSVLDNPKLMPVDTEFRSLLTVTAQAYKIKTGKRFCYSTQYSYETFSNQKQWAGK
jgi:hypothetical protein